MEKIRTGIIGVGWGALVHVPAFRAVNEFEVVALCSRRPESVAAAGAKLGISDFSTDWQAFVRRDDLDLISVTAPVTEHLAISVAALEAGKHVLCEKPAALDADAALTMVNAAERSGRATAIGFEKRWLPQQFAIWELVREGYIGTPFFINICERADYWHPSHAPQSPWMYRRDEGGGFLMGALSHTVDWVLCVFGDAKAVCADVKTTETRKQMADGTMLDVDADDTSNLLLRLKSGATAVLSMSAVCAHGDGLAIEIFGSEGTITMDWDGTMKIGKAAGKCLEPFAAAVRPLKSGIDPGTRRTATRIRATAHMLEEWLPAFQGRETPRVTSFRGAWQVQRVIDAARASSDHAGWVAL